MANLSKVSLEKLKTCDARLQAICHEAIKTYDFVVLCGHRSEADQEKAFREGHSKVKFPNSKHNVYPSLAVDLAPYPIDWIDLTRFHYLAGVMLAVAASKGIPIEWGGDWKMRDYPHYQLKV